MLLFTQECTCGVDIALILHNSYCYRAQCLFIMPMMTKGLDRESKTREESVYSEKLHVKGAMQQLGLCVSKTFSDLVGRDNL